MPELKLNKYDRIFGRRPRSDVSERSEKGERHRNNYYPRDDVFPRRRLPKSSKPRFAGVRYEVIWTSYDEVLRTFESDQPLDLKITEPENDGLVKTEIDSVPVEEVQDASDAVLKFTTRVKGTSDAPDDNVDLDKVAISQIELTMMTIYSQPLLKILREVVPWYPSQALSDDSVTIQEPYPVLLHYIDELREKVHELATGREIRVESDKDSSGKTANDLAFDHLIMLLKCLNPTVDKYLRPMLEKLSRPKPVITYENLWYLFKPGIDIYRECSHNGTEIVVGAVVSSVATTEDEKTLGEDSVSGTAVSMFSAESDGRRIGRVFSRSWDVVNISKFEGEKDVLSLPIYPCKYFDETDGGARRRCLEERGRKYYAILRAGWKYAKYSGLPFSHRKTVYENAAVVADISASLLYASSTIDEEVDRTWSFYTAKMNDKDPYWQEYDDIVVKETPEISPRFCFLMWPIIACFIPREKEWRLLDVDNLVDFTPAQDVMHNLVLDEGHAELLMAVCEAHASSWKTDFIAQKGEGRIILLHGPPGVGKTYTVESISEATGRPLISLTIADIGLDDEKIESNLVSWFKIAEAWNGILLIDEADVFLERRSLTDIHRNGLVSVFLRQLEYFKGLIFLTTNRTGQIDDAFVSRISTVIGYNRLDKTKRQELWNRFFEKLETDMSVAITKPHAKEPIIEIDKYAKSYLLNDDEVEKLEWNGREIRNALQTAISLAMYQASKIPGRKPNAAVDVETKHFQSVVKMSGYFKDYMSRLNKKDEAERAELRRDRIDR